ncbi:MAG: metallophosphoesterase [Lachnospiraceae bacterium]|nr:metallophosphoesterase [Lachnospiraceae bacterium]
MNYVISDIHGRYDLYKEMLEKIKFSDSDTLYVLGDCADRGPDGIKVWLDMMERRNVVPFIGNHDEMAYKVLSVWIHPENMGEGFRDDVELWFYNGGKVTYDVFKELDEATREKILWFMDRFIYHTEMEVNGERYFLSHTIGENPGLPLGKYSAYDYIWGRINYDECYDENTILVTGHTPTGIIDPEYSGKIYIKNNHIAVDCGAAFKKGRLGCICLDTMEEFYTVNKVG